MMRFLFPLFLLLCYFPVQAQQELPEFQLDKSEIESQLRFLAADELMGRRTGEPGNDVASRYIAEQFRQYGLQLMPGQKDYFQNIPFEITKPVKNGAVTWNGTTFSHGQNLVIMAGSAVDTEAKAVFAGYGLEDAEKGWEDYKGLKVKGKIVVVIGGVPDSNNPMDIFKAMKSKKDLAKKNGAIGLIELYRLRIPWPMFSQYMMGERMGLADNDVTDGKTGGDPMFYAWLKEDNGEAASALKENKKVSIKINSSGVQKVAVSSRNVCGFLPGTDPDLADEYVLLSAHFDHVGTGTKGGGAFTAEDSIFNGARDNAMGTVALLSAVKSFSLRPAKRPVAFVAFTGEEVGLLGSQYYAEHPLIPLHQTIFNLNTDGAGYNDTTAVSILGYDRMGIEAELDLGSAAFGLRIIADPAPEQNLFDRSDNVSFAAKGIPAPTFSPGVTDFDEALNRYYHQVADNPDSVDFDYLLKYCKAFVYTSRIIADKAQRPFWKAGDKYEAAGKKLYNRP